MTYPKVKEVKPHVFSRRVVRRWWVALIVVLAMTLALEFTMHPHASFGIDGTPFFHAWYGFAACLGIIIVSKLLGVFLKRPEQYYDEEGK